MDILPLGLAIDMAMASASPLQQRSRTVLVLADIVTYFGTALVEIGAGLSSPFAAASPSGCRQASKGAAMTEESRLKLPAFDPGVVAESNFTSYPEPHRAPNQMRYNRRLGDHAGLQNFGVNLTRIVPGGQSSYRHAHSRQDEFVLVLEGEVVLQTNDGEQTLKPGMCAGFPAGSGDAHRFLNRSATDAKLLVIGDRSSGDEIGYPDVDMHAVLGADGTYRFSTKSGEPL
jgi:uncharacterized cupin superfamily protein